MPIAVQIDSMCSCSLQATEVNAETNTLRKLPDSIENHGFASEDAGCRLGFPHGTAGDETFEVSIPQDWNGCCFCGVTLSGRHPAAAEYTTVLHITMSCSLLPLVWELPCFWSRQGDTCMVGAGTINHASPVPLGQNREAMRLPQLWQVCMVCTAMKPFVML